MGATHEDPPPEPDGVGSRSRSATAVLPIIVVLLTAVIGAVVVLRTVGGEDPPEPPSGDAAVPAIDVASFPKGALAGEPAPEMSVPLFDGSEFLLSQHMSEDGRPLVLNLWASWCTPCRREIPEFSEVAEANPDVAFLGVAVEDTRGPAEAFAAEVEASYPLGIDQHLTVKNGYPFIGLPVTYLIASDGTVARQIQGQLSGAALQAFIDHDFDT